MTAWCISYAGRTLASSCAGKKGKVVASVTPEPGLALLHRHGDACLLHEGKPVTAGVKYILRSDVIFG